ncbi:alpha/beta hydrolase [Streptomyces sp. V4I2]|uniref:alpha/beta hydrolase n=1 Tax=Streptomyces sp. V4I2 TaxID=3042280 RepID=UPI0027818171|nr:alpha/beta hydrolase [Streptomyces sp. V4I2]MDQ1050289.1 pimeloyl-ACP methyl ester carboxylesterase [Streptomyces sp. V4I2]
MSGHLTAPASVLSGSKRAITFYQHGIASGEWYWRLDVPGYHYAEELAERGHASLTIDRLGYGASDRPDGLDTCIGAEADIAHQIVRQLRSGTYGLDAAAATDPAAVKGDPPAFDTVTLAGQSNGGQVVQIEAYSFGEIDGLMIMDWSDRGLTPEANTRFFSALQTCMAGGQPSRKAGDPSGYAYYDLGADQFRRGNFHDTEERVVDAATPHQNRHPCGDMTSQLDGVFTDLEHIGSIEVPVLLVYGDDDARVTGGAAHQRLFTGADTELVDIPGAGHYATMARSAPRTFDRIARWLDARGL